MPFDCQQIKEFRRCLGLTQTQLAEKLQVPQCTIARWETGKTAPNASHINVRFRPRRRHRTQFLLPRLQPLYSGESTTIALRDIAFIHK